MILILEKDGPREDTGPRETRVWPCPLRGFPGAYKELCSWEERNEGTKSKGKTLISSPRIQHEAEAFVFCFVLASKKQMQHFGYFGRVL